MTLLLVEDNTGIAQALKQALAPLYRVDHVTGGDIALNKLASQSYDVLIIESVLHDMQGLKVCQQARKQGIDIPILMLGKEIKIADKIQYLDQGIDEYLMKPFSLGELKARLRVFARRSSLPTVRQAFATDDLTIDIKAHEVKRNGELIELRKKEFAMLECLMQNIGKVVTREDLSHYAWKSNNIPWTNTVDVHMKYLRDKIDKPFTKYHIKTIHGLGYKLE